MFIYILIFIFAVAIYAFSNKSNEQSKLVLGIYLAGLALFVGCADMLGGYDRYIYGNVFDQLAITTQSGGDPLASVGYKLYSSEWGFLLFNQLLGHVTLNRYIFILFVTIVIYTLLFISIKRYCRNYPFAVIVFLGLWFFFTFTYLRQVMAATIGWLAIKYAIERKPIYYFIIVFIAFTFHNSAIVLAPFYFVPAKKFDQVFVVLMLIGAFALGLSNVLGGIISGSDAFMEDHRVESMANIAEGSFRVAYFIEACLFAGLLLWKYNAFNERNKKEIVLLNMAFLFCAILLVFVRSENGGRVSWHYMIGVIASITHLATHHNTANTLRSLLIVLFCTLYVRILTSWGENGYLILYPYKSFFTNGVREGDLCHDVYEYDFYYDQDKFYK